MEEKVEKRNKKGHKKFWRMKRNFVGKSQTEKVSFRKMKFSFRA